MAKSLSFLAQRAVLYAEYIEQRIGMSAHKDAARCAQSKVRRVRKAMGYSIPNGGLGDFGW